LLHSNEGLNSLGATLACVLCEEKVWKAV
jgi:hypothetical protein